MIFRRYVLTVVAIMIAFLAAVEIANLVATTEITSTVTTRNQSSDWIKKGQYLATAANCLGCHTKADGPDYSGGHPFHTPFGTIYSTNITSDDETGIGLWTEDQFYRAMRTGTDPDGHHLYPVFPYQSFARLSDEDISAIFSFVRTIPPQSYEPPDNEMKFPFGWRKLLALWKAMYLDIEHFERDELKSAVWNRGAYLTEGLAHCSACHSPRNALGAQNDIEAYTGSVYLDEVENGMYRPWAAVNITSAPAGLGPWAVEDLIAYLKTGHSPRAGSFGPMNKIIIESTSLLTDEDIGAMSVYLKSIPANDRGEVQSLSEAEKKVGEQIYSIHCATCHLPTGLTNEKGPPVAASAIVLAPDPASLINVILYGATPPNTGTAIRWETMEGFELKLDDNEVAALANYLRTSWGNSASKVTAKHIRMQR